MSAGVVVALMWVDGAAMLDEPFECIPGAEPGGV